MGSGMSHNEIKLDVARSTKGLVSHNLAQANTSPKQGMSKHNLNRNNLTSTHMPVNRPPTGGTTYPNTTAISVNNTKIKK